VLVVDSEDGGVATVVVANARVLVASRSGVADVVLVVTESIVLVAVSNFGGVDVLTSNTGAVEVVAVWQPSQNPGVPRSPTPTSKFCAESALFHKADGGMLVSVSVRIIDVGGFVSPAKGFFPSPT
jgi:hypothetical protein